MGDPYYKNQRYVEYENTWKTINEKIDALIEQAPDLTENLEQMANEILNLDGYLKDVIFYFWNVAPLYSEKIDEENVIPPGGGRKCETRTSVA